MHALSCLYHASLVYPACGISCHHKCQKNMPNLCGVNEKQLSEALKDVDEAKKNRRMVSS